MGGIGYASVAFGIPAWCLTRFPRARPKRSYDQRRQRLCPGSAITAGSGAKTRPTHSNALVRGRPPPMPGLAGKRGNIEHEPTRIIGPSSASTAAPASGSAARRTRRSHSYALSGAGLFQCPELVSARCIHTYAGGRGGGRRTQDGRGRARGARPLRGESPSSPELILKKPCSPAGCLFINNYTILHAVSAFDGRLIPAPIPDRGPQRTVATRPWRPGRLC